MPPTQQNGIVRENPVKGVKRIRRSPETARANRPWSVVECRTVLSEIPFQLKLPVALAMFTGLRKGDVLKLTKGAVREGKIWRRTNKTAKRFPYRYIQISRAC